jgi:hypothetical protein
MTRYTISASRDSVASLRKELDELRASLRTEQEAPATVAPVLVGKAGEKMVTTRAANVAAQTAKRYCDGHETHEAHGFAFDKKVCPRDGIAIAQ